MSKAVINKESNLPADVLDVFSSHEGEGLDYDTSELQIPFVRLLQALSPQLSKRDPAYIEGASNGDIFNTVTGQKWDGESGITVIPCYQETKYLKFVPRASGGGFLGEMSKDDPDIAKAVRTGSTETLPDGNELVKSDQHYCLVMDDSGVPGFGIVDMKSSSLKVSKRWKTQLTMLHMKHPKTGELVRPPLFGTKWHLTSVEESNDMGTWFNWAVKHDGFVEDKETLEAAIAFRKSIQSGEAKAVAEDLDNANKDSVDAF